MASLKRSRVSFIIGIVLCVASLLWTGFIFSRSMKNGTESGSESKIVVEKVEQVLESVGVEDPQVSEHAVRKTAHFSEYAVLSVLLCSGACFIGMTFFPVTGVIYSSCVAFIDEFVFQKASVGRSPQMSDVLIDSLGGLCGALFVLIVYFIIIRAVKSRKRTNF